MRSPRFQAVETIQRQGRTVAHIRDTRAGRDLWIHRRGERLYHWDRLDQPVDVPLLRVAANMALDKHAEELGRRTSKNRGKHLSLADRQEIRERYEGGEPTASIAQSMGIHPTTVGRSVKRRVGV